jgi:ubiquinone/menaquinone biosynthesis C-methylase UbiE
MERRPFQGRPRMTMKMGTFEKRFVNATAHSRHVAEQAVGRLRHVPLHAGWSYLDVGCGNGLATLHVADTLGLRAVGVDVDPAQIELARRAACNRIDVSFVTASVTQLPFATARFDIVSTNKTMHHVPEWRLALDEIKRVVAPGRYVVFADLNVPSALAPLLRPIGGHVAGVFTRRDLDRCFSGLRDVHRNVGWLHYEAVFAKP